ncbi:MAG: hypothetical protein J0L92_12855 [Deltaproteobacteria bacterium]|nr:hypothetical protein [Deltaproteobacteria bacterium]
MPDPISRSTTHLPTTDLEPTLRTIAGTRPDATLEPHAHDDGGHAAAAAAEGSAAALHAVGEAGAIFGLEIAGAALSIPLLWTQFAGAFIEGERRDLENQGVVLEGTLAVLEGRRDDVETLARMETDPAFAQGVRAADRYFQAHPEEFVAAAEGVRNVMAQGRLAVFEGRDSGPEFARRYETELPFRHAVEEARHDRQYDPRGFERDAAQARDRMHAVDVARRSVPISG